MINGKSLGIMVYTLQKINDLLLQKRHPVELEHGVTEHVENLMDKI